MPADLILNVEPTQIGATRTSLEEKRQSNDSDTIRSIVLKRSVAPALDLDSLLFQDLAHFPLVSLDLQFAGSRVSISALAPTILALNSTLRYLYFENVTLSGPAEELAQALTHHSSLQRLQLGCTQADRDDFDWNAIFRALQSLSHDLWLLLDFHPTVRGNLDGQVLVDLLSCPTIQLLYLGDLPKSILPLVTQALQTNPTLESLGMEIKDPDRSQIASSILNTNTTLTSLAIALEEETNPLLDPVLASLKFHNRTVTDLQLSGPMPWTASIFTALNNMLSQNTVIQKLHIYEESSNYLEANPSIPFYLKLNKAGRHRLEEQGASRQEWVETIIAEQDDVSVVFYFLSKNPVLLFGSDAGCFDETTTTTTSSSTSRPWKRRKISHEEEEDEEEQTPAF